MTTYRADIEYQGTRYRGWQVQANARSVAGELHRAIAAAGGALTDLGGSGRTDAGVHALRQTAHLRLRQEVEPGRFRTTINDHLPADIHVLDLRRVDDGFHARHDAVLRSYVYQIALRRAALAKPFVWWVRATLDLERMTAAAGDFVGRHDFKAFCEQPAEQTSTLVVVDQVELARVGDLILVRCVASHFLWKMVRRVVGALVKVGSAEIDRETLQGLIEGRLALHPSPVAAWTAPPSGLFLERVVYPGEPGLGPLIAPIPLSST